MKKYSQNLNTLNDMLIKNSDMTYDFKNEVTSQIKKALTFKNIDEKQISKIVTTYLQDHYPGSWFCIVG